MCRNRVSGLQLQNCARQTIIKVCHDICVLYSKDASWPFFSKELELDCWWYFYRGLLRDIQTFLPPGSFVFWSGWSIPKVAMFGTLHLHMHIHQKFHPHDSFRRHNWEAWKMCDLQQEKFTDLQVCLSILRIPALAILESTLKNVLSIVMYLLPLTVNLNWRPFGMRVRTSSTITYSECIQYQWAASQMANLNDMSFTKKPEERFSSIELMIILQYHSSAI